MKMKRQQYEIYKLNVERLVKVTNKKIKVIPIELTKREALENYEVVKIQSNQLTHKIIDYFKAQDEKPDFSEIIVNVVVSPESKKQGEKIYATVAKCGFTLNGKKYVRLYSGSGQIRRNTVTFIREDLYEPITESLRCGLKIEDFGDDFNAAKYTAYTGLNMSGCYLLSLELAPNVCIVDDFEFIRPHKIVNEVTEKEVEYIALPTGDYVIDSNQQEYEITDGKAVRKSDGVEFTIHRGIKKYVNERYYDEIENSPALNSFDGQGLMSPEYAEKVSSYLGLNYVASEMIVRAPWVKGLLATVPFHEYFDEFGIDTVIDSFGKARYVADIDCFISKSQFKMWKIYQRKCEGTGINPWDYHQQQMRLNNLVWGITRINRINDDDNKTLNYQYLQALQLDNSDTDLLCRQTDELLTALNSGDIQEIYNNLLINAQDYSEVMSDDEYYENNNYKKLFQRIIEANPDFINDKYVRGLILKECETKFKAAKLGKILVAGNFQFCVSDPIAQLEWIAKHHCGADIEVQGIVGEGEIYSNYWLNTDYHIKDLVLMRSPLIDRNEIAKRKLIARREHYFRYLNSGLIYSIHDLTALQQGGCDFDGDIIFSTNNDLIRRGCLDYETAKPLYYELTTTDLVGRINSVNLIKADVRGLNSAVGKISNKGGSLYAKLENYSPDSTEYENLYNSIISLGQIVGMEIDRIKTAVAPTTPLNWKPLQPKNYTTLDLEELPTNDDEERQGIYAHNALVPDIKPYYMRYNYDYLDKDLKDLHRAFDKVSRYMLGLKIDRVIERYKQGIAEQAEIDLYNQYCAAYPVVDSDCIVNHICHHFEKFELNLKKKSIAEGKNMLTNFVTDFELDKDLLARVKSLVEEYKRYRRFLVKAAKTNYNDNNKEKAKQMYEANSLVCKYYLEVLLGITGGDLQLMFNYLIAATDVKTVWDMLGDYIIPIIRKVKTNDYIRQTNLFESD